MKSFASVIIVCMLLSIVNGQFAIISQDFLRMRRAARLAARTLQPGAPQRLISIQRWDATTLGNERYYDITFQRTRIFAEREYCHAVVTYTWPSGLFEVGTHPDANYCNI